MTDSGKNNSKQGGKTLIEALAHQGPEVVRDAFAGFDQEQKIEKNVETLARQTAETLKRIDELRKIMDDIRSAGSPNGGSANAKKSSAGAGDPI